MEKKPKYLYTDGILKGKENLIFLILGEKEPFGLLSKEEKLKLNPVCDTLEQALSHLREAGYQTPSEADVRHAIRLASQEGMDYISITIPPN